MIDCVQLARRIKQNEVFVNLINIGISNDTNEKELITKLSVIITRIYNSGTIRGKLGLVPQCPKETVNKIRKNYLKVFHQDKLGPTVNDIFLLLTLPDNEFKTQKEINADLVAKKEERDHKALQDFLLKATMQKRADKRYAEAIPIYVNTKKRSRHCIKHKRVFDTCCPICNNNAEKLKKLKEDNDIIQRGKVMSVFDILRGEK